MRAARKLFVLVVAVAALIVGLLGPAQAVDATASVSGSITGPAGEALDAGTVLDVQLQRFDDDLGFYVVAGTLADWTSPAFSFDGLLPGSYLLYVDVDEGAYVPGDPAEFTLTAGESATGVTISLVRTPSVSGTVEVIGGGELPIDDDLSVILEERYSFEGEEVSWGYVDSRNIGEDAAFTFSNVLSGTYRLRASSDHDLVVGQTEPFALEPGDSPTITLTVTRSPLVSGTVKVVGGGGEATVRSVIEVFRDGAWDYHADDEFNAPSSYRIAPPAGLPTRLAFDVCSPTCDDAVRIYWNGTVGGTLDPAGAAVFTPSLGQMITGRDITVTPTGLYVPPATPAPPAAPVVVRVGSKLVLKADAGRRKAVVRVVITAPGLPSSAINGTATIRLKGKKALKTVAVSGGRAVFKLSRQAKGKKAYVVTYSGNGAVLPGAKVVKTKVK